MAIKFEASRTTAKVTAPSGKAAAAAAAAAAGARVGYVDYYRAAPLERIRIVKQGVPASEAKKIMSDLVAMPVPVTSQALNIPISTLNRKVKNQETFGPGESERLLGLARLIGQVEAMVEESGDPAGFNAAAWTARWLSEPLPALGGAKPASFMDTMDGQQLVSDMLSRAQSGAFS